MRQSQSVNEHKFILIPACLAFFAGGLLLLPKPAQAAVVKFNPPTKSVAVGESFDVTVDIDTKTEQTTATDTVITFDPNLAEITTVEFNASAYPTNTKILDNTDGSLRTTSTHVDPVNALTGQDTIMTITIKAKAAGIANFVFTCTTAETADSNIFKTGTTEDIIECGNLTNGAYSIALSGTTPAATATPTPTQTIPQSGNIGPTGYFLLGGAALLGIGALALLFL